jgi:hypothetical protein
MFKRSRIALLFGAAVAISLIISACGSSTTTGSTPTPGTTNSTLGTPGSYNCVQGHCGAKKLCCACSIKKTCGSI